MSRRTTFIRHGLIIQRLRSFPSSFTEIEGYLEDQSEVFGENLLVSKRTFDRERDSIRSIYHIDIEYNSSNRGYEIINDKNDAGSKFMLESFDMFSALNITQNASEIIQFSDKRGLGSEHLFELLGACRNKKYVSFKYVNFHHEESNYTVQPYVLKEVDYRWYLIAYIPEQGTSKIFGLDRVFELTIGGKVKDFVVIDVNKMFQNSFGIYDLSQSDPEDIILSFTETQGQYIRHQPLHHSQTIIVDDESEFRISMKLCLSYDLTMKLLSFGDQVEILNPQSLRDEMKTMLQATLAKY